MGPLIPLAIGAISSIFGGGGRGAAQDRIAQNNAASDNYRTQQSAILNLLQQREAATRDRADRALTSGATRAKQAVIAQMLAGYRPQSVSGLPPGVSIPQTSGGGLSALMSSPQAQQALQEMTRQALMAQLSGSDVPAMPDTSGAMLTPPKQMKPGKFESIASGIGFGGGVLSSLMPLLQKKPVSDYPGQYGGG